MFSKSSNQKSAQAGSSTRPKMPSIISENPGRREFGTRRNYCGMALSRALRPHPDRSEGASVRGAIDADTVSIADSVTGDQGKAVSFSKARVIADVVQEPVHRTGRLFRRKCPTWKNQKDARKTSGAVGDVTVATLPGVATADDKSLVSGNRRLIPLIRHHLG